MRFKDISNQRFGRLTAVTPIRKAKKFWWKCLCDCGKETVVCGTTLRKGGTKSCGCLRSELNTERVKRLKGMCTKHGHTFYSGELKRRTRSRTYMTWESMIQRCRNPRATYYSRYGGRGITVCDEWRDFRNFLADMGERPEGMSLDRIDNDKGYCKDNCRWADFKTQSANKSGKAIDFIKKKGLYEEYLNFVRGRKEENLDGSISFEWAPKVYLN